MIPAGVVCSPSKGSAQMPLLAGWGGSLEDSLNARDGPARFYLFGPAGSQIEVSAGLRRKGRWRIALYRHLARFVSAYGPGFVFTAEVGAIITQKGRAGVNPSRP
jgi:hypothetical protein